MKSKRAREAATAAEEDKTINGTAEEPPAKKRKGDGEVKPSKKSKKDKKDKKESRKERKDKKKDLLDLPEEDAEPMDGVEAAQATETNGDGDSSKKSKKAKKTDSSVEDKGAVAAEESNEGKKKKDKKKGAEVNGDNKAPADETAEPEGKDKKAGDKKKKSKGDKKAKTDAAEVQPSTKTNGEATAPETVATTPSTKAEAEAEAAAAEKGDRHIVFVGNLPYSATTASVSAHFAALKPVSVRCLTKRDEPTACRGIAFVEFANVWTQRTCLDRFHHSLFDDGVSPARKINVELTAGGGGTTKFRKDKIKAKNKKLDENRAKRIEREKSAKEASAANGNGNKQAAAQESQSMGDSIHPSRLARNPGLGH